MAVSGVHDTAEQQQDISNAQIESSTCASKCPRQTAPLGIILHRGPQIMTAAGRLSSALASGFHHAVCTAMPLVTPANSPESLYMRCASSLVSCTISIQYVRFMTGRSIKTCPELNMLLPESLRSCTHPLLQARPNRRLGTDAKLSST